VRNRRLNPVPLLAGPAGGFPPVRRNESTVVAGIGYGLTARGAGGPAEAGLEGFNAQAPVRPSLPGSRCRTVFLKIQPRSPLLIGILLTGLLVAGCRSTYYAAWEKFGVYKRDLLKKKVVAARDDQKEAGQQFKDALTRLKELYGFDGGKLEKSYGALQKDYERSAAKADDVRKRIRDVETVAEDLFAELDRELKQISTPALQASSRRRLLETRDRYEALHSALKKAEQSMAPVLVQFHDQVLYLKHNLNAQAIASLKGEATSIQSEIARLLAEMNASITQADEFIKTLQ
jgi:hypothetical protein